MALILNILNFVLGGFAVTLGWLFATIISAVLIITLPYSKEMAQLARHQQAEKELRNRFQ